LKLKFSEGIVKMIKHLFFVLLVVFSAAFCLSNSNAGEEKNVYAKPIFEQKCSVCHELDRAKSKIKTYDEWYKTVTRMKNGHSAKITDDEVKLIVDYLAAKYGRKE
jgi:cytochrome c5